LPSYEWLPVVNLGTPSGLEDRSNCRNETFFFFGEPTPDDFSSSVKALAKIRQQSHEIGHL